MNLRSALLAFFLWMAVLAVIAVSCSPAAHAGQRLHVTDYDPHIQIAAQRWMPEYDWRWLRAQCYQESRFRSRAVSPAGARGLCQFMPGTWSDASRAIGVRNVNDPRENAWAAGWYMRRQLNIWVWNRTDLERLELAQAGYNAGAGNILAAQRLCGRPVAWSDIAPCLPQVTGHHAQETKGYVENIRQWFEAQCLLGLH